MSGRSEQIPGCRSSRRMQKCIAVVVALADSVEGSEAGLRCIADHTEGTGRFRDGSKHADPVYGGRVLGEPYHS